jgi:RimJ/RimL family protein N-acetyltransferase
MIVIHPDVAKWVMAGIKGGRYVEGMQAIGYVKDNELVAGVAFESQNRNCMWGHQRITKPPSKMFWITVVDYIFNQCGCKKFSAIVEVQNEKAIKLNKHIGFKIEATLVDSGENGDLHIMSMWRDDCRILKWMKETK